MPRRIPTSRTTRKSTGKKAVRKTRQSTKPARPSVRKKILKLSTKAIALGVAALLLPQLVRAVPVGPPKSPATLTKVKRNQAGVYHQSRTSGNKGFTKVRASKRLAFGTVFQIEQTLPRNAKPNYVKLSVAKDIKLTAKTLLSLGLRTPQLGKGDRLTDSDFGLILATNGGKTSAEVHKRTGKGSRYTIKQQIGDRGISADASLLEPNCLTKQKTFSIGANNLHRLLEKAGINLGKLSTSAGMNFPKGKNVNVYVSVAYPIGANTKIGLQGRSLGGGEDKAVAGFFTVSW
ncbi:MAG: hypothetical protein HOE11_02590 [Candidatus Diapherotrites archaeon]|nr:hypothetical protein [Candidatus Diapherotrites archaeon]MBT4597065.1 hypothetical protein [Candidatus Diapherotrites archaeon]